MTGIGRAVLLTSALTVAAGVAVGWTMKAQADGSVTAGPETATASPAATVAAASPTPTADDDAPEPRPSSPPPSPPPSPPTSPTATAPGPAAVESVPPPAPTGVPVYLTFDDGPDPTFTPQVLDLLAAHGAAATFFVQGSQAQAYPELVGRMAAEGHSVQNHAWNHPRLTNLTNEEIVYSQLIPTNDVIAGVTGTAPTCLRAPFGAASPEVAAAAASAGLEMVGWHINPADYSDPGAAQITANVLPYVAPGSIVLLHDAGAGARQQTVDALATLLPELSARGYQPQALCQ